MSDACLSDVSGACYASAYIDEKLREIRVDINTRIVNDLVANDIEFVTTVPCKQLAGVIDAVEASPDIYHIPANKEDERPRKQRNEAENKDCEWNERNDE